jgi:tetratricopeptide (TPR) repeat protein
MANSLNNLGNLARTQGDFARARSVFEESLALQRELGNKQGIANAFLNLGTVAGAQGNTASARGLFEAGLALQREIGDKPGIVVALVNLGLLAFQVQDYAAADACLAECLRLCLALGDKQITAYGLEGFAALAKVQEQPDKATRLYGASDALRTAIGAPLPPAERAEVERALTALCASLGEAAFDSAWSAGRALSWEQGIAYALEEKL